MKHAPLVGTADAEFVSEARLEAAHADELIIDCGETESYVQECIADTAARIAPVYEKTEAEFIALVASFRKHC